MEKLITIRPYDSKYKDVFEKFNDALTFTGDLRNSWWDYEKTYKFSATHFGGGGDFVHQDWKGMYDNVPETIELWIIQGTDFGLDIPVSYDEFTSILKGRKFIPPPFGTGLWLPEALRQQQINFEGKICVFSPIKPYGSKIYKTVQIVLQSSQKYEDGKIIGTLESLRPTEDFISPMTRRVVQRI